MRPLEDVLEAFALESVNDRATLERYLRDHPAYAAELVDMSRELSREPPAEAPVPTPEEEELIEAAWNRLSKAASSPTTNPFSSVTSAELKALAQSFGVPKLFFVAIQERRVRPETFPERFIRLTCAGLNRPISDFKRWIALPGPVASASAYKADEKPTGGQQVSFEALLLEFELDKPTCRRLLEDDD
jgi:hypothetical protein